MNNVFWKTTEKMLRLCIRNNWPNGAEWVEPALGSSLGLADVYLDIKGQRIPVELKLGTMKKSQNLIKWNIKIKPSQYLYHYKIQKEGKKSFMLVINHDHDIYAFPGWALKVYSDKYIADNEFDEIMAERERHNRFAQSGSFIGRTRNTNLKEGLERLFNNERFWDPESFWKINDDMVY